MARLSLHLLGEPRVTLDGESINPGRRKVPALLAYLAVTGRRHSRDELAELLYGQQHTTRAAKVALGSGRSVLRVQVSVAGSYTSTVDTAPDPPQSAVSSSPTSPTSSKPPIA